MTAKPPRLISRLTQLERARMARNAEVVVVTQTPEMDAQELKAQVQAAGATGALVIVIRSLGAATK